MNNTLTAPFHACEVEEALKQMAPLKAPGPDGMPPLFNQHCWGVVENDVTSSVLSWLNSDDSLLFCRAMGDECRKIIDILDTYEGELGQKVNKNKTTIFFSKSIDEATKQEIKDALGLQEIVQFEQYLWLPSLVGRRKKEGFNFIKEKVWQKLQGWEGKLLSQADREKFWWGQRRDKRKIHWLKWEELTKSKLEGGCRWRIGNGKAVRIWQNHWLPRKNPPQVLSPMVDTLAHAKVEILIDKSTRQWNHELVDDIFTPVEAELIKAIPLSRCEVEDSMLCNS
uniref:Reverse transcriptase n=1 Tax=Quercus lobata TaxID=97700 RepID=A0A7N2KX33_QUELO